MRLQLANRINTDPDAVALTDLTPRGDSVLDPPLATIAGAGGSRDTAYWADLNSTVGPGAVCREVLYRKGLDTFGLSLVG